jgi:hypothetical protein
VKTGHGCALITVSDGDPLGGYLARSGGAQGSYDPLEVHAVVLDDGTRRVALIALDLICVNTDLAAALEEANRELGVDHCWVSASHTHAGPDAGCRPGGGRTPAALVAVLRDAAMSAVRQATARLVTSSAVARRATVLDVGGVRARPDLPPIVPVDAVEISNTAQQTVGLLVVQPIHPTVLPHSNRAVSADLVGATRRALAAAMPGVWVVVLTGAAGDISTRGTRRAQSRPECDRLGSLVAAAVLDGRTGIGDVAWDETDDLRWASAMVDLPAAAPPPPQHTLPPDPGDSPGASWAARIQVTERQGRLLAAELARSAATSYPIRVEILRAGRLHLAAVPGEPFLALGESIRDALLAPAVVLGYTNGYVGYLPTAAAHQTTTYEVLAAAVGPPSEALLIGAVAQSAAALTLRPTESDRARSG